MKALVLDSCKHMSYTEVERPEIRKPDEVLISIKASAICGSDIHGYDGSTGRRQPPVIMGHEASGVVVAAGEHVESVKTGDRVTFDSTISCGACEYCKSGRVNLCDSRRVVGVSCDEYRMDGTFAEYIVVPERIIYKIPEGVSFVEAALTEPASVAAHAVNITPIRLNESIAVVGSGLIGLLIIQIARTMTSGPVIAIDPDPSRRESALAFGADASFNPNEEGYQKRINETFGISGIDRVFEAVGVTSAIKGALTVVKKGGSLTLVGNISPFIELPLQSVVTREITLYGSCAISGEYPAVLSMMQNKTLDVLPLVSVTDSLENGASWFDNLYHKRQNVLKVVLTPQEA